MRDVGDIGSIDVAGLGDGAIGELDQDADGFIVLGRDLALEGSAVFQFNEIGADRKAGEEGRGQEPSKTDPREVLHSARRIWTETYWLRGMLNFFTSMLTA